MHAQSILLFATSALAATVIKARQPAPPAEYTVTFTSDNDGSQTLPSSGGVVTQYFYEGDWGNQIRSFGGPNQFVDSVTFETADGKQARSLICVFV
ncbi:uncharacterized protein AB675_2586 [Cyphellophora attinorum]|uniref:Uncharacterized protein n=1 Tax=Cyphellophora attinorum TaxID=1664694 RepID=A0A0N1HG19_9EURO|nr:uncharacterized protein AB675_2586 [Phialophora attinorum]KPI44963.1 hypothetical protein AB675_2586 [Phialophora attinorum]